MMPLPGGSGGTVNGRTLARLREQGEQWRRMERENYAWKLRRTRAGG
jgi:hypothetical protein